MDHGDITQVLVAIPSASGAQMRRIVQICKKCEVHFKTIPGIMEIIDGRVSIKTLRDVNYEGLLGRQPVRFDTADIPANFLINRVVWSSPEERVDRLRALQDDDRTKATLLPFAGRTPKPMFSMCSAIALRHELNSQGCQLFWARHRIGG